jgi:hypothetical protein
VVDACCVDVRTVMVPMRDDNFTNPRAPSLTHTFSEVNEIVCVALTRIYENTIWAISYQIRVGACQGIRARVAAQEPPY